MKQISRLVIYILMAVCEILWKKPKWVFQRVWDVFFGMSDVSSCKQLPEPLAWCDTDEDTRLITPKAQREIKLEPESKPELERESEIKIYPPTPSGVSKQPDGSSDNRKDRRISRLIIEVLFRHLNRRRQRQFWLVVCLMLIAASFEVFSLGVVLPFIGILAAPDRVYNYSTIASLAPVYKLRLKFSFFPAQPLTRQHVMCFGARITLPHCDVNHFDRSLNPHATPLFTPYYIY